MIFEGIYRRFVPQVRARDPVDIRYTANESFAIAQLEAPAHERARSGRTFVLGMPSTPVVGINVNATLSGMTNYWSLWNGDQTRTYYFEEIGAYITATSSNPAGGTLWCAPFTTPVVTVNSVPNTGIYSLSNSCINSSMLVSSIITITTPAILKWRLLCQSQSKNTNTFGGYAFENRSLDGSIAIPPGSGLAVGCLGVDSGTQNKWAPFARWYEIESDLE